MRRMHASLVRAAAGGTRGDTPGTPRFTLERREIRKALDSKALNRPRKRGRSTERLILKSLRRGVRW